jgi:hypothetical protein
MGRTSRRKREAARDDAVAAPRLVGQVQLDGEAEARREFERMKRRGDLVYERTCAKCSQTTWGALGGMGPAQLRVSREEAERILATHGRFVCSNCDPAGKHRWMVEVGTKLGFM